MRHSLGEKSSSTKEHEGLSQQFVFIHYNIQGPGNDFYPGGVRINKKNFQKIF